MPRFHCNCLEWWLHMCLFVFSLSHGCWFEFLVAKCNSTDIFKCLLKALAVATLGGDQMGQRVDNLTTEDLKRFYLQVCTMSLCILPCFVSCLNSWWTLLTDLWVKPLSQSMDLLLDFQDRKRTKYLFKCMWDWISSIHFLPVQLEKWGGLVHPVGEKLDMGLLQSGP